MVCSHCQRPIDRPDSGCRHCGRPALQSSVLDRAEQMAAEFARRRVNDPWLRSASLLSYSLRSRQRGFLDDPARPFTKSALRFLFELAWLGGPAGVSPLAETSIRAKIEPVSPALAHATLQLLDAHRGSMQSMDCGFEDWLRRL
jgi:hypothetical protein